MQEGLTDARLERGGRPNRRGDHVGSDIHELPQKTDENHATVTEIANRKSHITSRISSAETSAENIKMSLEE